MDQYITLFCHVAKSSNLLCNIIKPNFAFQKNQFIPDLVIILLKKIIFLLSNILYLSITQVEDKYKKYK